MPKTGLVYLIKQKSSMSKKGLVYLKKVYYVKRMSNMSKQCLVCKKLYLSKKTVSV